MVCLKYILWLEFIQCYFIIYSTLPGHLNKKNQTVIHEKLLF